MTDGQQGAGWEPVDEAAPYVPVPGAPPRPDYPPEAGAEAAPEAGAGAGGEAGGDLDVAPGAAPGPGETEAEADWWRHPDPGQDAWADPGHDAREAAWEVGAQIGEAVAAHLPAPPGPPPTPAEQGWRGLDLRWLGLKYNLPAAPLAVLATWRGESAVTRVTRAVTEGGIFAPLGWVLLVVLVGLAVMMLPMGGVFAALAGTVLRGLTALTVRAWKARYISYLLRLLLAVACWAFVIAVLRVVGGTALNWMTGA
ncbi:hypothetical protein [Streptomyces sp. NPDC051567]|uniref:hypothetical protein n=1 Tax=Streptomyces sp. NPDC051567 TaxID=3365660 RepID=UPI0037B73ECD